MKSSFLFLLFLLAGFGGKAQYIFNQGPLPDEISLYKYAALADAGYRDLSISAVKNNSSGLQFKPMGEDFGSLGFTDHTFWLKFDLDNQLDIPINYYLETAEPVTDNVDLYLFNQLGRMELQRSGDHLEFSRRTLPFRKTLFLIKLPAHQKKSAFIKLKNDGEKNTLPLLLHSEQHFLDTIYHEQLIFGLFYGVLFTIFFTYLFFFFALKEITFLYYSLYVLFTGLCHAALDGFLHQYILRGDSWFNLHAVLIFALAGSYCFGKYSEIVLEIKTRNRLINTVFKCLYLALGAVLIGIVFFPVTLTYAYPIVNLLTLSGMLLILVAIVVLLVNRQKVDPFYLSGISVLFICFTIVILLNFGYSYQSIFLDNLTKFGIGMELIALSLSMANRIWRLKSKQEELQTIELLRAKEMNDTKSFFLSNMSHELRTPLNAIVGLTHLIEHEITDVKLKAEFAQIKLASSNLVASINDILDFSKIDRGELELDNVSFSPVTVINHVYHRFCKQAEEKGLHFIFESSVGQDVRILGDPVRLDQIINNVLNNAVKFTSKGTVFFTILSSIDANNLLNLNLIIRDTGEGIPAEKLETVYQMFSQSEVNNKRRFGGFGIGLCVVKALVELQAGTIQLESTVQEGTTCTINLAYPLSKEIPVNNPIFPRDDYDLLGRCVLVVEDNPMNQMVLKMIFRKWKNTSVSFANNGLEGLDLLREKDFDIVLMDLQMPVMDGYEAISAIRNGLAGPKNIAIPIIAITADLMQYTKERVFQLGVNNFMTKPVDQEELYEKMTSHLSAAGPEGNRGSLR